MNGGGVTPRPTPPTPQETLYTLQAVVNGQATDVIVDERGRAITIICEEWSDNPMILSTEHGYSDFHLNPPSNIPGWQTIETDIHIEGLEDFQIGNYRFTADDTTESWSVTPALEPLQRPLYSHEYTYGNFITNGERNESNNMKAAYINVGGAVQLFKENTTAGKWVTVPNDNNLALMDAPLTSFEAGPPSDFTYQGFTFTFEQGDVDGYTIAPALSII